MPAPDEQKDENTHGSPLRELLVQAAPTVAAMTSFTLMQALDKLMVSRIGPDPIYVGAQGNGGLASFVPISIAMGCLTVINSYVAQNLGANKPERGAAYAWNGVYLALAWWLVLIPFGLLLPAVFRALWAGDPRLDERVALAAGYGQPLVFAAIITMSARCFTQYFYGMHKPGVVLTATLVGNAVNFICNSVLIYGPTPPEVSTPVLAWWFDRAAGLARTLGIPRLGVPGAAYGTVIGTCFELLIPLCVFLCAKYQRLYGTRSAWRFSREHCRDILRIGWPPALMFGSEMICWGIFMVGLVGSFGTEHSTAGWIAHQYMSMSFMPTVGISVAVTSMVGKCMGMGRPDLAAKRAWLGVGVACAYMTCMALLFVFARRWLVDQFIDDATPADVRGRMLALGASFMIATACFQFFDGIAMTLSGALRGAGDTVAVGVWTVGLAWGVIVGGGLALVKFAPQLGSLGPWIAAAAYIVLLSMVVLWRFAGGHWKSIRLVKPG
jgi:MATE family multidrug resistance protein